ncbi:MAG TPA: glycine--tRNA ligase [Euryarchaeota archaeon]|nr:glycine--tRNA ligase [Euryarchaeota archaeon]
MPEPSEILSLAKRRGFLWPAYEIYGGVAGLFDYGPLGAEMKRNIEDYWRQLYVRQEGFLEITCPLLAPKEVFEASGHLKEFTDLVVQCDACSTSFRADHLAEGLHEQPSRLSKDELCMLLNDNNVVCPECGGHLCEPATFNLMFKTAIGAGAGGRDGYMRPETAQGMFVNFNMIYRYAREKLPVGAVQIGSSMRNEISPRQGVIRLREFNMMEAELFVHPDDKSWPNFANVKDEKLKLLPDGGKDTVTVALEKAVGDGMILNETLAYFMWLTWKFLSDLGVDPDRMRFRQHARTEMAHYASDCWDCEALLGYGWVELVGVADRGCYDVSAHLDHSGADLTAFERFDSPKMLTVDRIQPDLSKLGPIFKGKARAVADKLAEVPPDSVPDDRSEIELEVDGERLKVPSECFRKVRREEKVSGRKFVPHVIEPSYGLDRILYALLDHAYGSKEDYVRLRLSGKASPVKLGVFPLVGKDGLDTLALEIHRRISSLGVACYYDDSGSIGRRYARMDEIGTPFCVTLDYDTLKDDTVTLRDRDTAEQIRVKIDRLPEIALKIQENIAFEDLRRHS